MQNAGLTYLLKIGAKHYTISPDDLQKAQQYENLARQVACCEIFTTLGIGVGIGSGFTYPIMFVASWIGGTCACSCNDRQARKANNLVTTLQQQYEHAAPLEINNPDPEKYHIIELQNLPVIDQYDI